MAWFFDRDYILAIYEDVSKLKLQNLSIFILLMFLYTYILLLDIFES